jgi:hypothetical protein
MTPTPAQIEAAADAIAKHPDFDGSPDQYQSVASAALTATAEVGEPTMKPGWATEAWLRAELAATIERCAQVVENYAMSKWRRDELAAAIRALKDKP